MLVSLRRALLCLALALTARTVGWLTSGPVAELWIAAVHGRPPPSGWALDRLVVDIAAALLSVGTASLLLSAALILLADAARLTGPTADLVIGLCAPRWWRRCVVAICGAGLASTVAASTSLAVHPADPRGDDCPSCALRLDGLPWPDLPSGVPRGPQPSHTTVVRPGDSLWVIARNLSGPRAGDAALAQQVDGLYAANRRTIGSDPDLLLPGTTLTIPGGTP